MVPSIIYWGVILACIAWLALSIYFSIFYLARKENGNLWAFAFFNVLETRRQQVEEGANKYYHGLPITSMAIVLPLVFMLQVFVSDRAFVLVLYFALAIVGTLFIVDFKLKKPDNKTLVFLVVVVAAAVIIVVLFSKYRVQKPHFFEKPLWKIFRG